MCSIVEKVGVLTVLWDTATGTCRNAMIISDPYTTMGKSHLTWAISSWGAVIANKASVAPNVICVNLGCVSMYIPDIKN